jgi:hypothetical protein
MSSRDVTGNWAVKIVMKHTEQTNSTVFSPQANYTDWVNDEAYRTNKLRGL